MPFTTAHSPYTPSHSLPHHLEHKPVYALPYEHFDGIYIGQTDSVYLSVGIAQYDPNEISAKVMRHTGQWSRQAEELPIHRAIDLSIFLAKALFDSTNGAVKIKGDTYLGQDNAIAITKEAITPAETQVFDTWLLANGPLIKDRLNSLCDTLNDLRRRNKI